MSRKWLYLCLSLFLAYQAGAQVAPAVNYTKFNLKVGGEFSAFKPDFGAQSLYGIGVYADLDMPRWAGLEVEGRTLSLTNWPVSCAWILSPAVDVFLSPMANLSLMSKERLALEVLIFHFTTTTRMTP